MKLNTKSTIFLAFVLFLVSATLALRSDRPDPELEICQHQCRVQTSYGAERTAACLEKCRTYQRAKEGGRGEEAEQEDNPFVFQPRHFETAQRSEHGRLSFIPRFTERSEELLEGIENFRFGVLEVEPKTFVAPSHLDADTIAFVSNGQGAVRFIKNNKRESFNIREGDVVSMPAGATTYIINTHNNERLVIVKLLQTISPARGRFEFFLGTGRQSFLNIFSPSIMEAAYDVKREEFERVLRGQDEGPFIQVSDQQLRSIREQGDKEEDDDNNIWPLRTKSDKSSSSKRRVNIFKHRSVSNNYGKLFEVDNDDLKALEDFDVSFANITQGGMMGPLFNSEATKLAFVVDGKGWLQMVSPRFSSQPSKESRRRERQQDYIRSASSHQRYEKISAPLRPGTTVVIPPGYPFVQVASKNTNLQIICFGINARDNERVPLAGKNNLFAELEDTAKEIAFGVSSKQVDEVFKSNEDEELFFKGPDESQQEEGRSDH